MLGAISSVNASSTYNSYPSKRQMLDALNYELKSHDPEPWGRFVNSYGKVIYIVPLAEIVDFVTIDIK